MSLPGADELFRTTGGVGLQPSSPRRTANGSAAAANGEAPRVPAPGGEPEQATEAPETTAPARQRRQNGGTDTPVTAADGGPATPPRVPSVTPAAEHGGREQDGDGGKAHRTQPGQVTADAAAAAAQAGGQGRRRGTRGANRRPSGRERHDEKITVYVSAEELMDLEHARLVLRGEHGLAVDRGRIVREAVAVVLADLESRGDASILVRRLRGR
ncbi:Syd protein [Streptomyces sp. NBRC 110611]|nr:Syd protein [Streptomyces sp. NBRC 110611]